MKSSDPRLTIGDLARRFGLATSVLRHWESMGLLSPTRAVAERRRYGDDDIYRVATIMRAKAAGLGLDQIRDMMATQSMKRRAAVLIEQRDLLARRIADTQQALELVDHVLDCQHKDFTQCPDYRTLMTADLPG